MSRHGRPQAPAPSRAPALASSAPPSAVAPPPAPPPAEIPPPPAAPAPVPPVAPVAAPLPPASLDAAPAPVEAAPAPATPRYVAIVRIFAGYGVEYVPGEEIPARIAADGLAEGVHWRAAP